MLLYPLGRSASGPGLRESLSEYPPACCSSRPGRKRKQKSARHEGGEHGNARGTPEERPGNARGSTPGARGRGTARGLTSTHADGKTSYGGGNFLFVLPNAHHEAHQAGRSTRATTPLCASPARQWQSRNMARSCSPGATSAVFKGTCHRVNLNVGRSKLSRNPIMSRSI